MRALSSDLINALVEISGHAPMACAADDDIAIVIEEGVLGARDELVRLREANDELEEAALEAAERRQFDKAVRKTFAQRLSRVPT